VVYGHTPVVEAEWLNGTICLDTGCVFGGALTALRYPENELVSVPARQTYFEPVRPRKAATVPGADSQTSSS
jgi:protein phosphatase